MVKPKIKFLSDPGQADGILSIKYADIETIDYLPDNIKAHDLDGIKQSIELFGFVDPIGINKRTGHDIFGNGRLETLLIMLSDGEKCPKGIAERVVGKKRPGEAGFARKWYAPIVDGLDFDETDETLLAIAMNRLPEKGGIDNIKANEILSKILAASSENFAKTGYNQQDLDHIRRLAQFDQKLIAAKSGPASTPAHEDDGTPADKESFCAALNQKWQVKECDLWQIGRHRLLCLDATKTLPVKIAFSGLKPPRLVFTSPPYDNQRIYEMDEKLDWTRMMIGVSQTVFEMIGDPADFVVNLGPVYKDSEYQEYWQGWLAYCKKVLDQPLYGKYVWDKLFGFPGNYHGRLARSHEFLFHFSNGHAQANKWIETTGEAIKRGPTGHDMRKTDGSLQRFDSPATVGQTHKIPDSVVRIYAEMTRGIHSKGHPAVFPVELPTFMMRTWTQIGDVVFDPFGGSGTTLVACENEDRTGIMSELSPNYCALILERMSELFPEIEIKKL